MSGQDNYKYVYNQTQYNEHDEIYIDTSQERMDFSLTKGIKIWMAFNRELYFCIKLFGLIIKNFVFFGFKCALDIPSVVMSIVVQIIFFRGVIRGDTNPATCSTQDNQGQYYCMDQSLKSWLITEIVTMYLMGGAWLALNIYIYCVVHSPRFQYTYYLSLRGQDIDEDEEFKNKYYN
eukprot:403363095